MTTKNNELSLVHELIGQTLSDVGAYYEILILRFGEYEIHVNCFARVIHNGNILLTTQDYQSWDEKDHKHNDMYVNIANNGAALIGQTVCSVEVSPINDLFIVLDNGARIEIFNSEGDRRFFEKAEQWFFYKPRDKAYPYISVGSKTVEREIKE